MPDWNNHTYPEEPKGIGFTETEKKTWDRNLKKLKEKIYGKFKKKPRKKKEVTATDGE